MNYLSLAVTLVTAILDHLTQISTLIEQAGGGALSIDQWKQVLDSDTQARGKLSAALDSIVQSTAPKPAPVPPASPPDPTAAPEPAHS